jgi:hypothetical protein
MTGDRYPVDPLNGPANMAQQLRDLERRIGALEGAPLIGSNLTTVDPTSGTNPVIVGKLPDDTYGILIVNENGRVVQQSGTAGFVAPQQAIPMFPNGGASVSTSFRPGTTSGSFTELWRGDFWSTAPDVSYDLVVFPNAGNMDWRIRVYEYGTPANGTPTVAASGAGETANIERSGSFTIPSACLVSGTDPVGRRMTIRVEAKRNSGSAQVDVAVAGPPINRTT